MAPLFPTWCLRTVVTALAVRLSTEYETCKIWSSAGAVVERGSSFQIFCTFPSMCERAMNLDNNLRQHKHLNSSTVYIDAKIMTTDRVTYTCQCKHHRTLCGIDIFAGYPPGRPGALTCVMTVTDVQPDIVECRWISVTETYPHTTSSLWVMNMSGNHANVSEIHLGSSEDSRSFSAGLTVDSSIKMIFLKVSVENKLGHVESDTYNFTLRDIVKPSPPVLNIVECSSRSCKITWRRPLKTHLQVQYMDVTDLMIAEEECIPYPDSDWLNSSSGPPSVHSLEPSRRYCFRARAKLNTGLWSDWSRPAPNRTQEEAPDKELDVWFARATSLPNILTVYWKSLNGSEARGRVLGYMVHIYDNHTKKHTTHNVSASDERFSVQSCVTCLVTVSTYNSKGSSPPARLPTLFKTAQPPQDLRVIESKDNVTLYWSKADPTLQSTGYLVEWYLQDQQFEKLHWVRLSSAESQAVITEIDPYECYDGAVYAFYENSLGKASFTGVNTLVSVPTGAPSVTRRGEGHEVTLTWTQIPRHQRGGCVRNYTIYVGNNKDFERKYDVPASEHKYTINRLPPDTYIVWVTARTEQGEGPHGETIKFIIQQKTNTLPWLLMAIVVIVLVLLFLFKLLGLSQRLKTILILLPDVPDPSNSEWAKAFTDTKSKMDLHVYPSDFPLEEEEHIVKFFENPKKNDKDFGQREGLADVSSVHQPDWDSGTAPQTPYIKSFSHDSDSSQDMATTAGYFSSQAEESVLEEGQEEEEECIDFYPRNVFDEVLLFGGGLTLDAVKIDCRNLWENDL